MGLSSIRKEINDLRRNDIDEYGRDVSDIKAPTDSDLSIDTLDVLSNFEEYESFPDTWEYEANNFLPEDEQIELDNTNDVLTYIEELYGLEHINSVNTFSTSAPISNHLNVDIYQSPALGDNYLVEVKAHRHGDVRSNYTESALLEFVDIDDFYQALDVGKEAHIEVDGYGFDVNIDLNNVVTVYDGNGLQVPNINEFYDLEDLEGSLREHTREQLDQELYSFDEDFISVVENEGFINMMKNDIKPFRDEDLITSLTELDSKQLDIFTSLAIEYEKLTGELGELSEPKLQNELADKFISDVSDFREGLGEGKLGAKHELVALEASMKQHKKDFKDVELSRPEHLCTKKYIVLGAEVEKSKEVKEDRKEQKAKRDDGMEL